MEKKKKVEPVEPVEPVEQVLSDSWTIESNTIKVTEETPTEPPALVVEPQTVSTPALSGKVVRVRNQGAPFPCDLTQWGYGMRWPTNAVYTIPDYVYVELLKSGLNGVSA